MTKPPPCTLELTSDQREVVSFAMYGHFFACENNVRRYRQQLADAKQGKSDLRALLHSWQWRLRNVIAVCELLDVELPLPARVGGDA